MRCYTGCGCCACQLWKTLLFINRIENIVVYVTQLCLCLRYEVELSETEIVCNSVIRRVLVLLKNCCFWREDKLEDRRVRSAR